MLAAIEHLLHDDAAKEKAAYFATTIAEWDGPKLAARKLLERYGNEKLPEPAHSESTPDSGHSK